MSRRRKPRYYVRKFLNLPGNHNLGAILASVERDSFVLDISDCSRKISLEFNGYGKPEQRNALHKVDVLIEVLTGFRAAMIEEFKEADV